MPGEQRRSLLVELRAGARSHQHGARHPEHVVTAKIAFDNFGGRWGEQRHLNRFLQGYAVEKARIEARRRGHTVTEQALADGSIKLTIQVGGAA